MLSIGIDLGGTKIAVGIVDEAGRILIKKSIPTCPQRGYHEAVRDMAELINALIYEGGYQIGNIDSIGIGCPSAIDKKRGEIIFANNLNWRHVPIGEEIKKYFNLPVYVANDAEVAALGEWMAGACRGTDNSVTLTLGTGVGSGIILNGKLFSGTHGVGAHLGHMIVEMDGISCTCGNRGCWEQYVSATALIRAGKKAVEETPDSLIVKSAGGNSNLITAKMIMDAAKQQDQAACEIVNGYIHYLSMGVVTIVNAFDPQVIAIGGGVSQAGDVLLNALREEVERHIFYQDMPHAYITLAQLGNDAGVVGATMLGKVRA